MLHVIQVTAECQPFTYVGGLAQVPYQIASSFARKEWVKPYVIIPRSGHDFQPRSDIEIMEFLKLFNNHIVYRTFFEGITFFFIGGGEYLDLTVYPPSPEDKYKALDFVKCSNELLKYLLKNELEGKAVILHAHDWQSGLTIPLAKLDASVKPTPPCMYTMHNYFQAKCPSTHPIISKEMCLNRLGYDWLNKYLSNGHEGFIDPMSKGIIFDRTALYFADVGSSVSKDYAKCLIQNYGEIHYPTVARNKPMLGILNGVNPKEHSPKAILNLKNIFEENELTKICEALNIDLEKISNLDKADNKVQLKKYAKLLLFTLLKKWQNCQVLPKPRVGNISEIVNSLIHKDLNWDIDDILCVYVGRIAEQKGFDILVQCVPHVISLNDRTRFIFMGSGGYPKDEKKLIIYGGEIYNKNVVLLEMFSPEIRDLLFIAADIFAMPSRYEPCGLTPFEAMGTGGTPCVVNPVGGLKEIVLDNEIGVHIKPSFYDDIIVKNYPCPPEEALSIAINQLIKIISDKNRYNYIINRCFERVKETQFSWDFVANKYLHAYDISMQKYMQYIYNYEDIKQEKNAWLKNYIGALDYFQKIDLKVRG
ncbi:MAG: glycosyltransferase, partial [Methanosarcinales archaeon]